MTMLGFGQEQSYMGGVVVRLNPKNMFIYLCCCFFFFFDMLDAQVSVTYNTLSGLIRY